MQAGISENDPHSTPQHDTEQASDLLDRLRREQPNQPSPQPSSQAHNPNRNEAALNKDAAQPATESESEHANMPPEARRALVNLLKHGVILAAQKAKLFDAICRYQSGVRSHLADVYLKLVLDEKTGIAFVAQVDETESDDADAVSLITRRTLSLYDTLLLLVLRKHYQERESAGEQQIIIDIERIEASLTPFLPLTNSMKSDRRKLVAALKKMLEKRIISLLRGSGDRFEITPMIRYVVNAQFLEQMLETYQALAREAGLTTDEKSDDPRELTADQMEIDNE